MANPPIPPSDLSTKIDRDLATLLYQQGSNNCFVILVTSAAAAFATTHFKPGKAELTWWAAVTLLSLIRLYDIRKWLKDIAGTEFNGKRHIQIFSIFSLLPALLFAIFPFLSFPDSDYLGRSIFVVIISGIAGGATTVLAANKNLALTYISLLLVAPCVLVLVRDDYNLRLFGVFGLLYWIILCISIFRASEFIYNAARLHHHNEELLSAISAEKQLVETSNEKLQQAYTTINTANEALEQKVEARTKALSILASTDDLTGLKNRHTFVDTLNEVIEKTNNHAFSILFVDLDGFKEINDIRGHIVGDKVLRTIAQRLQQSVKQKDFLCRWGGDEFVLIIEESDPLLLDTISARICQSIHQSITIYFDKLKISASIGIAIYPIHGSTVTDLINAADVAMYESKKIGKNGAQLFENAFREKIRFEQHLLNGLYRAIELNQFELFYQPIIPCHDGNQIIYEALIRWKFEKISIPPVIFIPIAESCDAIFELGDWVINQACEDLRENRLGSDSFISINVSVKQLLARGFVDSIAEQLANNKIRNDRLQIEITESVFANNLDQASIVLNQLRELGISIALDDFGSGFSSLSYLQSLPIDTIKIDRSFVNQLDRGGDKIIEATVSIAKAFGCKVVAEGIETEQQQRQLEQLGVDYLQGFLFARPAPYDQLMRNELIP